MAGNIINMSTDKARILSTQPGTSLFWRGDNSWSNILKQTSDMGLGIDTNLKIGTARKDLNFDITNGSGTDINEGYAGGITWGSGTSAYAGIYYQTSGDYGSRLHFATTNSYANGAYTRLFIAHDGKIGINTLSPSEKLEVNGTARFDSTVYFANGTTYYIDSSGNANVSQLITNSTATIKSTMRLNNSKNNIVIYYRYNNNTSDSGYCGLVRSNPGDGDLYYNVRFRFLQYSYNSSTKARLDKYELFDLPTVTADRTDNASYSILTTKNTVTIAQGGTSATSAAGARYNLSVPAMSLSTSYPKLMAINSSGEAIDNWIMIGSTTTYGILPGASGGAGSGHCYIGTSSWYWGNAYIDQIYGTLHGNAATATKATQDGSGNTITSTYLKLSGGTMTGLLNITTNNNTITIGAQNTGCCHIYNSANIPFAFNRGFLMVNSGDIGSSAYPTGDIIVKSGGRISGNGGNLYLGNSNNAGWVLTQDICSHTGSGDTYWSARADGTGHFKKVYGAVWNDYAEMRNVPEAQININSIYDDKGEIKRNYPLAGHCVSEVGNGQMHITTKRLQKGCKIISDTFGFCIGETETCKTPIAVTGRVLAYPYESTEEYKNHIGDCVCSGPNGTISIMTQEEKIQYPECIIGIISEIPTYDVWHCGNKLTKPIDVNGRIWIYVK